MNRKYLVYSLPILLILALFLAFFPRQKTISIRIDGQEQIFETTSSNVEEILNEANIGIHQEDQIDPSLSTRIKDGDSIEIIRATTYLITADGETHQLISVQTDPKEILKNAGVEYSLTDLLLVNGVEHSANKSINPTTFTTIELRRPITLTILLENETLTIQTTAATIGEALWEAEIPLYQNEQISLPSSTLLKKATTITISPASIYEIIIGEQRQQVRSTAKTVGEVLAQTGISLQNLDYSIPAEDQNVPENSLIEVVRVEEVILGEQELVPFTLLRQPMPNEVLDTLMILQVGEYGLKAQRIRVRYENGEEVLRTVEDEWQVRDPVPRIEGYGTLIELKVMDTPHGEINYYRAMEFYITSYYAGDSTTPPWYGRVSCYSRMFEPGFVAVDLDYVPCGTKLYVEGFGFAIAMDTGQISGAWLDIGYRDDEYIPWHRFGMVYFLSPPPAPENIPYIIPPGTFY